MTTAAAIETRTAEASARKVMGASRIAGIDILSDFDHAEAIWRDLETQQHFATPYQRFDFLKPWQREVGEREGLLPFIIVGYDADHRPLLLLPLTLASKHGVRGASFMGGKHTTFNMALWDKDFAPNATRADLDTLISAIGQQSIVDVLALTRQPASWMDVPNPLALLPTQPSANDCPLMKISPEDPPTERISGSFRRRLKGKERKLQALSGYRYHLATTDVDIARILDWFFRVKPLRMAEQKLPDVFAEPGVEDFIRGACMTPLAGAGHVIDLHALECDDEIIAIFAGVADGHRFSMMFNTYTMSENSRHSPGLILMRSIIDHYAEGGYRALDLGIGSDDYKRLFCKHDEPIFDSFIPLNLRGRLAASAMSGINHAKHLVKHNQALFNVAQKLRSALHR
jgi:CelD/BcsL family acetyltransferase involved in cellulose biosynthesis